MYKCKYFTIKELVHPNMLSVAEGILWMLFDDRILRLADRIREKYGVCTVNAAGLVDCGLRDINSGTGVKYSQHKFGRALDLHIRSIELKYQGKKAEKIKAYNAVREELLKDPRFEDLCFEDNISWLHIDVGNREKRLFNP